MPVLFFDRAQRGMSLDPKQPSGHPACFRAKVSNLHVTLEIFLGGKGGESFSPAHVEQAFGRELGRELAQRVQSLLGGLEHGRSPALDISSPGVAVIAYVSGVVGVDASGNTVGDGTSDTSTPG